ncbi:hypothetical protein [Actinoallomurus sp. NPDC050550]|uniref:hypothetical protein n=1 Tax=Actinoallomurus sp. NPDC050550 TaxID=3154937 RepID=UPI0033DF1A76
MRQRRRKLDGDLALWGDADGLVAVPLAGFAISLEEPALGLPPLTPFGCGELGSVQVVSVAQQPLAAAHDTYTPGLMIGPLLFEPVLEQVQAAGLGEPLLSAVIAARCLL